MYEKIIFERDERDGRIAWIKLNKPESLNTLDMQLLNELYDALVNADKDETIHAIIISSAGKAFCAGADLKDIMNRSLEEGTRWLKAYWRVLELIRETGKPVIAAVRGACVAGGHELVMMCDLVVAGKTARLGQPEILVGSTAMGGGVQLLPLIVGEKRARELVFTARLLSAEEAYKYGLVNRVVDDEKVDEEARKLAIEIINRSSPQAFRVIKSCFKYWTDLAMLTWQLARDITAMVWTTEEFRDRAEKFLRKQKPEPRKFMGISP